MNALDRLAAEAAAATEPVAVPLAGKTVRVKPPMQWRSSSMTALRNGDFEGWAKSCLVNDLVLDKNGRRHSGSDDYAVWQEVDPTMGEFLDFMGAYSAAGGMGLGGIASLALLVTEHRGAIRSDLSRYHHVRLADLFTGALTYPELADYLTHLPPESAFQTELRDGFTDEQLAEMSDGSGKHGAWSRTDMLIAGLFDSIGLLTAVQVAKASNGAKIDVPDPLSRPGVVSRQKRAGLNPQQQAYMQRLHDRKEAEDGGQA